MVEDNLPPKDFADALVEDPANPPQLQALTGYRGRSAKEGHTRLYLDPELSGWVDIPDDAILLTRETQDEFGLGKTVLWARRDAQIEQGPQAAQGAGTGADFLQGQVAQDLGGGGAAAFAARPVPPLQTQLNCPTHAPFLCLHTPPRLCPPHSLGIACTVLPPCPHHTASPIQCPSLGIACTSLPPCPPHTSNPIQCPPHTVNPAICPSAIDACPTRICATHNVQQCLPHPTSNPQLCPVATPNPGCIPGTIGNPGGPVERAQAAQGFQNAAVPMLTLHQCPTTPNCPPHISHLWCYQLPTRHECPLPTHDPIWCPAIGPVATVLGWERPFDAQAHQGGVAVHATQICPVPQTSFCPAPVTHHVYCPIFTRNIHQCVPHTLACPVSPWCPTGTFTGPGTTPQLGYFGGGGGGF